MENYPVNKWLRKTMSIFTVQASLILITFGVAVGHENIAQVLEREVTINLHEAKFELALTEIEKAAHVKFVYSDEQMPLQNTVTLKVDKKKLNELLTELLQPYGIEFEADDNTEFVALKRIKKKDTDKQSGFDRPKPVITEAQVATVSGIVTDETTSQPLAGVNVIIKGTTNGTSTDATGRYAISVDGNNVLVFSFIGYVSQEIAINDRTVIDLALKEDVKSLNEVTVNAGYWNVTEKERTGNITKINAEAFSKQPVSNPLQALQGRVPGMQIFQANGLPGGDVTVQIRGRNSIRSDGNNPLFVVDGIPMSSSLRTNVAGDLYSSISVLNSINPSDIESIEVLKDGDATAIYGSRGSNGVVLITTKKGKTGKTSLNFNVTQGVARATGMMKLLNTDQYLMMRKEALKNDGVAADIDNAPELTLWDTTRNTDWQKELIGGAAHTTNLQTSVSGGNRNTQFLVGSSYYRETTVFPGDFAFQKGGAHFNLSHQSDNGKFKLQLTSNYVFDWSNMFGKDLTSIAMTLPPNAPSIYDENGNLNWENSTWDNPLSYTKRFYRRNTGNLISNLTLSYEILPGLSIKTNLGYNGIKVKETRLTPLTSTNPAFGYTSGSSVLGNTNIDTWIIEPQLEYAKNVSIGKLSVLIGATAQQNITDTQRIEASNFATDALLENISSAGTVIGSSTLTEYRYAAFFGRVNYSIKSKYLLNLTGRRDGSSRFGPNNRFSNFGAIGTAWVFSDEEFIKDAIPFVSFGKLRASYGITGSDQIPDYGYLDTYSSTLPYNSSGGLIPTRLINPDFRWESNKKFEAGMELSFFRDHVTLSSSWYHNRSSNQLVGYPLSGVTGFTTVQYNLPATVQNTGWEFVIESENISTNDFSWRTTFNLSIPKNKLIEYPNLAGSSYANQYVVGESLFISKRYHYSGVNPTTGNYRFENYNEDPAITFPQDLTVVKLADRQFYGGFQNVIRYRTWELDFLFQFVKQARTNLAGAFGLPGAFGNQPASVLDRWQKPGDNATYQRFSLGYLDDTYQAFTLFTDSDYRISDASFIRLKNVSLSYSLPQKLTQKCRLTNMQLTAQAQNMLTFTKYDGPDPENAGSLALPPLRVLTFGLKLSL